MPIDLAADLVEDLDGAAGVGDRRQGPEDEGGEG